MQRANAPISIALSIGLAIAALAGLPSCRTSQQESRRSTAARNGSPNNQPMLSRQLDSLLMIEQKLVEVIDSMTSLVGSDHERIRALEQQVEALQGRMPQMPLPPNDPPGRYGTYSAPPPPMTAPATFQDRYNSALRQYNDNNFEGALDEFQALERDDPQGAYASNYRYWEGECYYAERRYNLALQAFTIVLEQYPNSSKTAAAEFKTGECYEQLNVPQRARDAYERVIADYPSSEFRARAQARLKALRD